jgi:hypothetical protein
LEFPCFDGDDPKTWCCRAEQLFDFYDTPDAQRLSISALNKDSGHYLVPKHFLFSFIFSS